MRFILALMMLMATTTMMPFGNAQGIAVGDSAEKDVQLPEGALTEKAKSAYNDGRYNEAARLFRELAIRWPLNAKVYQTLARSYSWASEPAKAIIAYRHAQQLGLPKGEQEKIKAELDLLIRRVKKVPPKETSPKVIKAYEALAVRAKSGRFNGREGAIGGLSDLLETTEVSPRVGRLRATILTELRRHSNDGITRWWRPEAVSKKETLLEISAAWDALGATIVLGAADKILAQKVSGLNHLAHGEFVEAIKIMGAVATDDVRIRFALSIALIRAGRFVEAQDLLQALARGDADPRVHLLRGFVAQELKKTDAVDAFMMALENEDSP